MFQSSPRLFVPFLGQNIVLFLIIWPTNNHMLQAGMIFLFQYIRKHHPACDYCRFQNSMCIFVLYYIWAIQHTVTVLSSSVNSSSYVEVWLRTAQITFEGEKAI